jgi:endoglucanase
MVGRALSRSETIMPKSSLPAAAYAIIACLACGALALGAERATPEPNGKTAPMSLAARENAALGRGVNFGGMLEAPQEGDMGLKVTAPMIEAVKQGGFATIRLPVRFSNHALPVAPYTLEEAFMQRVDFAVDHALADGLNIIIDFHHYHQLEGDPLDQGEFNTDLSYAQTQQRFIAIWQQIAARYGRLANNRVLFEIYNEPHGALEPIYNDLIAKTLAAIRNTNPKRFVIVDPLDWATASGLDRLRLPTDKRLIVTIHDYAPMHFTHQGAEWIQGSDAWLETPCCDANQQAQMFEPLNEAEDWSKKTGYPIFLGEFGSNHKAPETGRVNYATLMREAAEGRGFSWAYWDFASEEFGPWNAATGQWHTDLLAALMPK